MTNALDLDRATIDRLKDIGGDEFVAELVGMFIDLTPHKLTEISTACEKHDADALERAAHSLKSSAGNLGLMIIFELAHQIEIIGAEGNLEGCSDPVSNLTAAYNRVLPELEALTEIGS